MRPLETDLLRRIGARDEHAVAELYDRVAGTLFGVVLRILADRAEAEDVLQEVFLQVWARAATYDPVFGAPLAWLVRIARNRAVDRFRTRRVREHLNHQPLELVPESRTDREGRVRFRLPRGGMWLVKAVHMVPAPAGANAEWASFWASLTFELRATRAEGR